MERLEYFKSLYGNKNLISLTCLHCHKEFGVKVINNNLLENIEGTFCEECYKLIWQK